MRHEAGRVGKLLEPGLQKAIRDKATGFVFAKYTSMTSLLFKIAYVEAVSARIPVPSGSSEEARKPLIRLIKRAVGELQVRGREKLFVSFDRGAAESQANVRVGCVWVCNRGRRGRGRKIEVKERGVVFQVNDRVSVVG